MKKYFCPTPLRIYLEKLLGEFEFHRRKKISGEEMKRFGMEADFHAEERKHFTFTTLRISMGKHGWKAGRARLTLNGIENG